MMIRFVCRPDAGVKGGRTSALVLALAATGLSWSDAAGQEDDAAAPVVERPRYQFLRFNEDWSILREADPESLTDFWDPIKYVPLNEDGSIWASFGGSTQLRLEGWSSFNFAPGEDDTFLLWRMLLHGDLHFGENIRAFVEGKSAQSTDRDLPGGRRPLDVDSIDLEQAFVDVRLPFGDDAHLVFRAGRQALLFGKQRLVSPLPWANTLRRWDGFSPILTFKGWNVHGFWTNFVPVKKYEFNERDRDIEFYGVYATGKLPVPGIGLDLYYLGLEKDQPVTFNGTTGKEDRHTVGGRLFGDIGATGFDYDFEGAYQFGSVGSGDVSAFMIGSQLGYTASQLWASPRFFLGFDYGSGDRSPGGDVQTFNQLFPLGHAFLGYADVVARQNVIDLNLGVSLRPLDKLTFYLAGHLFWRDSTADALYDVGGAVLRDGSLGTSREIGQEIDLVLSYRFDRHLKGELGYSHFFAGDFISESGPDDDIDFVYVQFQHTF